MALASKSRLLLGAFAALGEHGTVFNNANNRVGSFAFTNARDSNGNASTVTPTVPAGGYRHGRRGVSVP